ncbi:MAG: zinc-binding alcohol dehydrogenase [Planctomycetota bacterium]|nr:zinc-binding alcohol dehydrogenase [Planctomycetota bacterium]
MPKRIVVPAPRELAWEEYAEPALAADEIRIKAEFAAAKHGTEMNVYKGRMHERGRYSEALHLFEKPEETGAAWGKPTVGNMLVGEVVEKGAAAERFAVGDRVLCYSGFRETVVKKNAGGEFQTAWKLPAGVPWQSAVCMDPADFALAALRDGQVRIGDAVAVFGLGAIGLIVVQLAKLAGAYPVFAVDMLPRRLEAAKTCGADAVLDAKGADVGRLLKEQTGGRGVDVAIEYSASWQALQAAIRGVAYGGTVVAGAAPSPYGAGLDLGAEAHHNLPKIVFSRACSQPDRDHPRWDNSRVYETCWRLIQEGKIDGVPIVDPVVPFESLLTEYPKIDSEPQHSIKLGVKY